MSKSAFQAVLYQEFAQYGKAMMLQGLRPHMILHDEILEADYLAPMRFFEEAMREVGVGHINTFKRLTFAGQNNYIKAVRRKAQSPSPDMAKYRRLWTRYHEILTTARVAAKLENSL